MPDTADLPSPSVSFEPDTNAWQELDALTRSEDDAAVLAFMRLLPPGDTSYTLSHLAEDQRSRVLSILAEHEPQFAADVLEHFEDVQVAEMLATMSAGEAAAIVDEMDSDEQVDVLSELGDQAQEAILNEMVPEEAHDVRQRLDYPPNTAGGLMITEYLAYSGSDDVSDVRRDLRNNRDRYNEYEVRYLYATDPQGKLVGVVPMRELVMAQAGERLVDWSIKVPTVVLATAEVGELEDLFDRVDYSAVPVLDEADRLVGLVQRAAVNEALEQRARSDLARFGGIIRGEELRSMPVWKRCVGRLLFLLPIAALLFVSASIIALFEPTVQKLPILAAFLPVVAGICGSGGTQALAVSMRELSLNLITSADVFRVAVKEAAVALPSGLILGLLIGAIAAVWQGNFWLGAVVGMAVPIAIVAAKIVGGTVPVMLKRVGVDPAMASGPIVTTLVDLVSFMTTLAFAALLMSKLTN